METRWTRPLENTSREYPMGLLAIVSIVLGTAAVGYLIDHPATAEGAYSSLITRAAILAVVAVSVGVAAAPYHLSRNRYDTAAMWAILGWSVVGVAIGVVLAGGVYLQQGAEAGSAVDQTFLVEEGALVGMIGGFLLGVARQSGGSGGTGVSSGSGAKRPSARERVIERSDDTEALERNLTVVTRLSNATTRELPLAALTVDLAAADTTAFPGNTQAVARVLENESIPALVGAGLLAVHDETETIEYVGPEQ